MNSPRNSLILFNCFEHEYDNYGLCFIKDNDGIKMNRALITMTFDDHLSSKRKDYCALLPDTLKRQTFGDYIDKDLLFKDPMK